MSAPRFVDLEVITSLPQADGGTRVLLDTPALAREARETLRRDRAMLDALRPGVIVELHPGRPMMAYVERDDLTPTPWNAIRAALAK